MSIRSPYTEVLPDDPEELNVYNYARGLLWCYGPSGIFSGIYREGHGEPCTFYLNRFLIATRTKMSLGTPDKRELYFQLKKEHEALLPSPEGKPVWSYRSRPPQDFHNYMIMTEEEQQEYFSKLEHKMYSAD